MPPKISSTVSGAFVVEIASVKQSRLLAVEKGVFVRRVYGTLSTFFYIAGCEIRCGVQEWAEFWSIAINPFV